MSISDKLITVAENVPKVYNAGYEKGKAEGGALPADMSWVNTVETATVEIDYSYDTEVVTMTFPAVTTLTFNATLRDGSVTNNQVVKHLILIFETPPKTFDRMLYSASYNGREGFVLLERLTVNADTSRVTSFRQLFSYALHLKIIDGTPLDFSSSTNNGGILKGCYNIEHIRIVPNSIKVSVGFEGSKMLDNDSIQSIVDGLADLTGGTAQTLTLHADVKAKLTDTQLATITGKNWTVA